MIVYSKTRLKTLHKMLIVSGIAHMTKLYRYDRNDDGIMLNKRIY